MAYPDCLRLRKKYFIITILLQSIQFLSGRSSRLVTAAFSAATKTSRHSGCAFPLAFTRTTQSSGSTLLSFTFHRRHPINVVVSSSFSSSSFSSMTITNPPEVLHAPATLLPDWMRRERTKVLTHPKIKARDNNDAQQQQQAAPSSIVYWMQRDVRAVDNWALSWADHLANSRNIPLRVVYALPPPPSPPPPSSTNETNLPPTLKDLPMTARHGEFLLGGLEHVHEALLSKNIPLHIVQPPSYDEVGQTVCHTLVHTCRAQIVICDFSPLREPREWIEQQAVPLLEQAQIPLYQVDTHNIVPVWTASIKREVGARTLRPRIHKHVPNFLQEFPVLQGNPKTMTLVQPSFDKEEYKSFLQMDKSVPPVDWAQPGTDAAMRQFEVFCQTGLPKFDQLRNDPTLPNICSNLSPWINHGQVSFQRLVMKVKQLNKYANGSATYIEEGVVRRELSDNYVYYTPNDYDQLTAAAGWAQETLQAHANDPREYVYSLDEWEEAKTHDDLWNAAQLQVIREGQMHGFMRMYWAKKILEWSPSPEVALRTAQYLNDKYALDGRDPNGFVGVGWSIMGIHDQGWGERAVFGKIRFMNYAGCKRKFAVATFVARYKGASEHAIQAAKKHAKKENKKHEKPISSYLSATKKRKVK